MIEVPGRPETDVVVAVVVPVVDVETLRIEVADVHAVTVRVHAVLPVLVSGTEGEGVYLSLLNFIREHPLIQAESPPNTSKKFDLCLFSRAAMIHRTLAFR